jgi:uncharacterized protein DUF4262
VGLDLPEPEDDFDRNLLSDVRELGWHCVLVADEHHPEHAERNAALSPYPIYDSAFAYTVGLPMTLDHPEIVLVGRWNAAHGIIAAVVGLIEEGGRFSAGDTSDEVLEGFTVRFDAISDGRRIELLTYSDWANRREPFEALQLVLPDPSGRWPEDPAYDARPQPLIG